MALMMVTNGFTMAALLFIMGIGLSLSFGLLRVVNLSHGAFYLVGSYIGLTIVKSTGSWLLALLAAGVGIAILAFFVEFFLLRKARGKPTIETLVSLAVAVIISDLVIVIWGGNPKSIAIPSAFSGFISMFDVIIPKYNIFVVVFACFIGLAMWLVLQKTKIGMIIRAGVDNPDITETLGINIKLIFTLVFVVAGFMAGIAGVIGGTFNMVAPGEDWRILTYTLLIVIIGGMGSFKGTVVGAIIIGLIYSFGSVYVSQFSLFLMFAPVALILVIRPRGLFGRKS